MNEPHIEITYGFGGFGFYHLIDGSFVCSYFSSTVPVLNTFDRDVLHVSSTFVLKRERT